MAGNEDWGAPQEWLEKRVLRGNRDAIDKLVQFQLERGRTQNRSAGWLIGLVFIVHFSALGLVVGLYAYETYLLMLGVLETPAERTINQTVVLTFLATFCAEVIGVAAIAIGHFFRR